METLSAAVRGLPVSRSEALAMFTKTSFYDPQKVYVVQCVSSELRQVPRSVEPFFIIKEQQQQQQQQQSNLRYPRNDTAATATSFMDLNGIPMESGASSQRETCYYGVSGMIVKSCDLLGLGVVRLTECLAYLNRLLSSKSLEAIGFYTIDDNIDDVFDDDDCINDDTSEEN